MEGIACIHHRAQVGRDLPRVARVIHHTWHGIWTASVGCQREARQKVKTESIGCLLDHNTTSANDVPLN